MIWTTWRSSDMKPKARLHSAYTAMSLCQIDRFHQELRDATAAAVHSGSCSSPQLSDRVSARCMPNVWEFGLARDF